MKDGGGRGRLRHEIVCQKAIAAGDGAGGESLQWQDIATVRGVVTPQRPDRRTDARQDRALALFRMRLRHQSALLATERVLWAGRRFRVLHQLDPDLQNRWLDFYLEEET